EPQASNVASPKLLPLGNAYTSMAFLSLTRNSGSTKYRIVDGTDALRNIIVNIIITHIDFF
ncbi:MAG: hypothetical protein J6J06_04910, partial [Bacteroidaceae bacterium]|nr:hypothetical protein [Bacteroidaceae bacterium]